MGSFSRRFSLKPPFMAFWPPKIDFKQIWGPKMKNMKRMIRIHSRAQNFILYQDFGSGLKKLKIDLKPILGANLCANLNQFLSWIRGGVGGSGGSYKIMIVMMIMMVTLVNLRN